MGGVGKTQIALEYAYRYRQSFQCIFWLPTEDTVALSRAYCAIGKRVGLFPPGTQLHTGQLEIEAVQEWLKTTDKLWLLIFDNVEDFQSIAAYWPTSSRVRGAVIVTCQKPGELLPWANNKISVTHFNVETGARFLLRMLGIEVSNATQEEQSREISKLVGGLPVYLTHISGHISQSQSSLHEYLDMFHESSNIWHSRQESANWMYERTINAMFDVALTKLTNGARNLINVLAFLNPDGVPESLLFRDETMDRLEYLAYATRQDFLDAISDLRERQLVKREQTADGAILTIHRSLQEGILNKLNNEPVARSEAFVCALKALRSLIPRPSLLIQAEPQKWYQMEAFLPQLLSLRRAYVRSHLRIAGMFEFAEVLFDVGMNMWDRGLTHDGQDVLRTAEEVLDHIGYPVISPVRANIHLVLAVILDDIGISGRNEALERRKKALALRQSLFDAKDFSQRVPEDDILLYAALMDFSGSYRQVNRFDEVSEKCASCFDKYKTWGDIDEIPYEYAKFYNDMSFERAYYGDTTTAARFSRRAWTIMAMGDPTALLSNQYKLTWTIRLYHDGQHEMAMKELEEILNFRTETVGRHNYLTLQSLLALGILKYHRKDYIIAKTYLRQVLEPATRNVLPEETITRAKYYLSLTLPLVTPPCVEEASQLRDEARQTMERLIQLSPPDCDIDTIDDESVLYDYPVAAGLRISIFTAEASQPKNESSKSMRRSRSLLRPSAQLRIASRSVTNLTLKGL